MTTEISMELITPKKAEQMLNANKGNRSLRPGVAEKYAADMSAGKWTQCTVPISFYENGDVADGQHRLFAIIESGTSQRFIILRGLERKDGLNIDTGLGRTLVDNARISGENTELTNELISICRGVDIGARQQGALSNSQRLDFVAKHEEAARWAISNGIRGRGLRNAITLSAVTRAWYHEKDKERLQRFCEVVTTGFSDGKHESAAIALRNYLLSERTQGVTNSTPLWRDLFLKAQNAIKYFMQGKPLTVIRETKEEAYPLPRRRAK